MIAPSVGLNTESNSVGKCFIIAIFFKGLSMIFYQTNQM